MFFIFRHALWNQHSFISIDYHMYDFVGSKFKPLVNQSPILRNLIKEAYVNNKGLKVFQGFTIYFKGLWSKLQAKSITVDHTIKDELNEVDQENVKFADDCILHSKHRMIKELSQSAVENYGIDSQFKKSDQRYWGVKCHSCNTWNFPDETFPDCLMTKGNTTVES
ncbi:MAG: phage terminase large subunit family protein [Leptospiraceae bacterium]|nr:phage terminase large subunit family protein [Leptospiraceae bacterium]